MSIATELTLLANSKQAIKNSINQKGGNITDSTPLADYSTAIDNLPSGGDGDQVLMSVNLNGYSGYFDWHSLKGFITGFTLPKSMLAYPGGRSRDAVNLETIRVESGNPNYDSRNNCNAIIGTDDNLLYFGCKTTVIPNTVVGLLAGAFGECSTLTSITIPESVTRIDADVFNGCTSLTSANIPSQVTKINDRTFYKCSSLASINIPNGVTEIGEQAFGECSSLASVTIPNTVTSIGQNAFTKCTSLTSATLSNRLTNIPRSCFHSCSSLANITIPDGVTTISDYAFYSCSSLATATMSNGVTEIGTYAFGNCGLLTTITIPSSVTSIKSYAFTKCTSLISFTCLATTPPTLAHSNAFNDTNNCPIYVPAGSVNAYKTANNWSTYASRIQAIPE